MIFNKPFGRFRLVKKIATGGMAEVFLALQGGPGGFQKLVALKSVLEHYADNPEHIRLFNNEARLGAVLNHPNIVSVFDATVIEKRPTMVMEFVAGHTVEEVAARLAQFREPVPVPVALAIMNGAAFGLHAAYEAQGLDGEELRVVHRDISPHNILVSYDGVVKVFDFGVAVAAEASAGGSLAGKTAYMSPEQCRGKAVDNRSDVFSLGIVLHELITGQRLFKRDNHIMSIRAITEDPVPTPGQMRDDVPPEIDAVVMKALARNPNERYQSAGEFHRAIASVLARYQKPIGEEEIGMLMQELFRNEISENQVLIEKILLAPEHSESTIDLSTFDLEAERTGRSKSSIISSSGHDLEALAAPADAAASAGIAVPSSQPVLAPEASAAVIQQLQKAKRTNTMLAVALVLAVVAGGAGAAVLSGGSTETVTPDAAPETEEVVIVQVPLTLETQPAGATITINGEERAEVTPSTIEMPEGENVTVALSLPGYFAVEETVLPVAANPPVVSAVLEIDPNSPDAPIGSIRVDYSPANAQVLVDGEVRGTQSPVTVDLLTLNEEHSLRLEAEGFEPLSFPFTLDSRETLEFQLEMAEALDVAVVSVTSDPVGTFFVNEQEIGPTPVTELELPANQSYTLVVEARGYDRWRRQVFLRADDPTVFEIELERRVARADDDGEEESGTGGGSQYQLIDTVEPEWEGRDEDDDDDDDDDEEEASSSDDDEEEEESGGYELVPF